MPDSDNFLLILFSRAMVNSFTTRSQALIDIIFFVPLGSFTHALHFDMTTMSGVLTNLQFFVILLPLVLDHLQEQHGVLEAPTGHIVRDWVLHEDLDALHLELRVVRCPLVELILLLLYDLPLEGGDDVLRGHGDTTVRLH